jgi:hypothetical protein
MELGVRKEGEEKIVDLWQVETDVVIPFCIEEKG